MSESLSLPEMLADLERRAAFHRQQEEIHAQQENSHHEERVRHAAAREQAEQQLAVLKTAAAGAATFLREASPLPEPPAPPEQDPPRQDSKKILLVVQSWPADSAFGASDVAAEVNRRFAGALERPVSVPTAGRTLLRLRRSGVIRAVRKGISHAESQYERT